MKHQFKQPKLITYIWEHEGKSAHGMDVSDDPIAWLLEYQHYKESYFILSVIPITLIEAEQVYGELKGM